MLADRFSSAEELLTAINSISDDWAVVRAKVLAFAVCSLALGANPAAPWGLHTGGAHAARTDAPHLLVAPVARPNAAGAGAARHYFSLGLDL